MRQGLALPAPAAEEKEWYEVNGWVRRGGVAMRHEQREQLDAYTTHSSHLLDFI